MKSSYIFQNPPPVKAVAIPKKSGGERTLGIPTVSDRIAQATVKLVLEPLVEPHFHEDSYGYRPGRSAHQAIAATRKRCWWHDWVLEFDIKGLFDNIDHGLLMRAVRCHTDCRWVLLYLELHPVKTKVVLCKDIHRKQAYETIQFDFLGYTFRPRRSKDRYGRVFVNFTPAIRSSAAKAIRQTLRGWRLQLKSDKSIEDLAHMFRPVIQG